jgi:uncharacterized protein DUF4288
VRKKQNRQRWYWAFLLQMTVKKAQVRDADAMSELWESLVLIRAPNAHQAYSKAMRIGRAAAGDDRRTLRLFGKPATCFFLGISSMGEVYGAALRDGVEVMWSSRRRKVRTARALVRTRAELLAPLLH